MRLDHLLSKESTSLPIVTSNEVTEEGDSQLVHWLLVLETSSSVGDSVLTDGAGLEDVVLCSVLRECAALALVATSAPAPGASCTAGAFGSGPACRRSVSACGWDVDAL